MQVNSLYNKYMSDYPLHAKSRHSFKKIFTSLLLLAALWGTWHFYSGRASAPSAAPGAGKIIHVEATKVTTGSMSQAMNAVGTLQSNESVEIKTEISGRIASIAFKDGQEIKAKDPLFMLDDSVQQAELAKAKANVVLATNNVKRASTLAKSGFTSKVGLEESQAELNLARANVQLAEANLEKTVIRAPFDGVMGIRKVSPGDIVTPQMSLVSIDQYSPIKIEFSVPERYLREIKVGSQVELSSDALPGKPIPAIITAIDSRVGEASRGIRVQALSENTDHVLFPGQFVTVNLKLQENENTLLIPDQALVAGAKQNYVYLVVDGKAKKQEVKVGLRAENKAVVLDGLKEGDLVITAGQQKVQEGTTVEVSEPTPVIQTGSPDETPAKLK